MSYRRLWIKKEKKVRIVEIMPTEIEQTLEQTHKKHQSELLHNEDRKSAEQHQQAHVAGNPVKKILLKLNLSDHSNEVLKSKKFKEVQRSFCHSDTERLSQSDEVLKLKNFKKDATLKLSKSTNQERYEHVGPEVASLQDGKVTRWQSYKMVKR
ncbi:hypothetical protein Tco_0657584 [Tanacetum coccineum]